MIAHQDIEVPLQPADALALCKQYLEQRHATVMESSETALKAYGLPPLMFNFDSRLYSKSNPTGFNPLAFIGAVEASVQANSTGSILHLRLATGRPYFVLALVLFVAGSMVLGDANPPPPVWLIPFGFVAIIFLFSTYMMRVAFKRELLGFIAMRSNNSFKPKPLRGSA